MFGNSSRSHIIWKGRKNVNSQDTTIFEEYVEGQHIIGIIYKFSPFILNIRDGDKMRWANQIPLGAWRKGMFSIQPHAYILLSLISPLHDNGSWNESFFTF